VWLVWRIRLPVDGWLGNEALEQRRPFFSGGLDYRIFIRGHLRLRRTR
jgi:hypothetical protein